MSGDDLGSLFSSVFQSPGTDSADTALANKIPSRTNGEEENAKIDEKTIQHKNNFENHDEILNYSLLGNEQRTLGHGV